MPSPAITVQQLTKEYKIFRKEAGLMGSLKGLFNRQYDIKKAVNDISFTIGRGELVGFLGANGAGKTTTLKILSGLLYPSSGTVSVLGFTPSERKNEFRKQFAIVLGQKNQLLWDLPAEDSFLLLKEIYELTDSDFRAQLDELVGLLDVKDKLGVQLRRLSLGERMKMEFIGALLHQPNVLFLDEPTIGLDVVAQQTIRQFIKRYNAERETTILLTSHYMQDIEELCERVMIIDGGKLFFDGALSGILEKFSSEKFLSLDFQHPVERAALEAFGVVESFSGCEAKLRVERKHISKTAGAILAAFEVQDLTIEEIPIEDIIRAIFAKPER
jgi:ABC-2 type transport system ATP-binding protein